MNKKVLLRLIDIVRDLNKSISMHIDNHGVKYVDKSIQNVAQMVSDNLSELEVLLNANESHDRKNS